MFDEISDNTLISNSENYSLVFDINEFGKTLDVNVVVSDQMMLDDYF